MGTIQSIINAMNTFADFSTADSHDNSGLLVGEHCKEVKKAILALDITNEVVNEAHNKNADVIISHHPVIYHPLYRLSEKEPACLAVKYGISCICSHSPLDLSENGINNIIFNMIQMPFELSDNKEILCPENNSLGYGYVCNSKTEFSSEQFATTLKKIFNCTYVRYTSSAKKIKRIAFCSGGAGSMLNDAIAKGADAYFTGDTKHDQLITARNQNITLVDCGHFHTEDIVIPFLKGKLFSALPDIDFIIADADKDPASYII